MRDPSDVPSRGTWWLPSLIFLLVAGCASSPAYLQMEGDDLWEAGVRAFEDEDWDRAIAIFERFVVVAPGDTRSAEARIYTARSYSGRGEHLTAASEFERILQLYPSHALAPEASLGICRSYAELAPIPARDQSYTRDAVIACDQTAFEFRGLNVATVADSIGEVMIDRLAESDYRVADFYTRFGQPFGAIDYYRDVVDRYPNSRWAPQALFGIYEAYKGLDWGPEADETADQILSRYPESDVAEIVRGEQAASDPQADDDGG
jgi:outer membrane protein assembly factor BamD